MLEHEDPNNPGNAATLDGFGKEASDDEDPTTYSRGFFIPPPFAPLFFFHLLVAIFN